MGKSGYLPDISSTFAFWRANAIISFRENNLHGAEAALYNINSCLTEEYIITIDTAEYQKGIHEAIIYECSFCKAYTPIKHVNFYKMLLPLIDQIVLGEEYIEVWDCIKCKKQVPRINATIIHEKRASPFFQKFMYEPPKRELGLLYRYNFTPKFRKWFYKFLELLQHQLALYRIEYVSQHNEEMKETGYQDPGDKIANHN